MKLGKILEKIDYKIIKGSCETEITSVVYDSGKVTPGALFICISGFKTDGHRFIGQAVEKGAVAILVTDSKADQLGDNIILVKDARKALAIISANWFGHPADKLQIIGVTGTKGKTTVTHMLKSVFESAGYKVGMIGTLGAFIGEEKIPTTNTTPESYELHFLFDRMYKSGCQYVVMEVSSQALKLGRTAGISFLYGVFLNLSPDHISEIEHKDFTEYLQCKKRLFDQAKHMVVNIDDSHWAEVMEGHAEYTTFSCLKKAEYMASDIQNVWQDSFLGVHFMLSGRQSAEIHLSMPGEYNVENALAAIAVANELGIKLEDIVNGLERASVKGRTQVIKETAQMGLGVFIIDYAHNTLSMENLLQTLRSYHPERLICVFGSSGDRSKLRRFGMGEMAGKYADYVIVTMDDPRLEPIDQINADIIEGLKASDGKYKVINDRAEAIRYCLDHAREGDFVVLAGKGHEEFMNVGGKKHYFSEERVIRDYLKTK